MMIEGRIWKDGNWWLAEAPAVDVMTQGKSRADAQLMLADAIESIIGRDGFHVTTRRRAGDRIELEANDAGALIALVLKRQRSLNGLSLADVSKRLGQASRTAYARYEQGESVPSVDKLNELLRAVAPNLCLTVSIRQT